MIVSEGLRSAQIHVEYNEDESDEMGKRTRMRGRRGEGRRGGEGDVDVATSAEITMEFLV
jgi:hypothetical protein